MYSVFRKPSLLALLFFASWLAGSEIVAAQDITGTRPGAGGAADKIAVAIGLLDIVDIDNKAQVFTVDLYVQLQWQDPRLAADSSEVSEFRLFALSDIWTPTSRVIIGKLKNSNIV